MIMIARVYNWLILVDNDNIYIYYNHKSNNDGLILAVTVNKWFLTG